MILIEMDMPKNCLACPLADRYVHDECPIYSISKSDYVDNRFEKCPLREIEDAIGTWERMKGADDE